MSGRRRIRASGLAFGLMLVVAVSTALGSPEAIAASRVGDAGRGGFEWPRFVANLASPFRPYLDALDGDQALNKGSDGRLTFLLLGSDSRGASVSRTDTILIMSVKGNTISAASIPRDTARIPNPSGGTFSGRVNGILRQLLNQGSSLDEALARFEVVIESLLGGIEIDYHALIWFGGFTTLVSKIDPVTVNSNREIRDQAHLDDPNGPPGVYFPKWDGYALYANNTGSNPYCNGAYRNDTNPPVDARYWCHRALPFVRSRKGPGNDDWVRARRQQDFIAAAIRAVNTSELSGLVSTAQSEGLGKWWTNYPINATSAMDLYNELHSASLVNQVVFKPSNYAGRITGTSAYQLKLSTVRQWAAQYLK